MVKNYVFRMNAITQENITPLKKIVLNFINFLETYEILSIGCKYRSEDLMTLIIHNALII